MNSSSDSDLHFLDYIVVKASSTMADNRSRVIFCAVQGDSDVFKVRASVDNDVADLKKLVFEILDKDNKLRGIYDHKLILWQVSVL
jgi:hypothetical protein